MKQEQAATPLYTAIQALVAGDAARFHMPGHKGKPIFAGFDSIFAIDYTEIYGTGNLYEGTQPIRGAERLTAQWYGAEDCHFLIGGSTQGIQAMLCAAVGAGGTVLLDRTCHKSVVSACALFDLHPFFVYPTVQEVFGFPEVLSALEVETMLDAHPESAALLVVSPNYYGVLQDIPMLAALCHRRGKKLLVDAAHGAHLPALGIPSPVAQGADAAVLSAHKTLPCMGQGAYLLFADSMEGDSLRRAEAMVGTSSPSYPILCSLDLARAWLAGSGGAQYRRVARFVAHLRQYLQKRTALRVVTEQNVVHLDPCRLTIHTASVGMTGHAFANRLYEEYGIACEMADNQCVVFIITGADGAKELLRLLRALVQLGQYTSSAENSAPLRPMPRAERMQSVRAVWFGAAKTVCAQDAVGQICARAITPYPPGIPLLWPGEKITAAHIEFLQERCYTDIKNLWILAE